MALLFRTCSKWLAIRGLVGSIRLTSFDPSAARGRCIRGIASLLLTNAERQPETEAMLDCRGRHTYGDLVRRASRLTRRLTGSLGQGTGQRVGLLLPKDHRFVDALLAVWMCGHIAVPLHPEHPSSMWRHCVKDSQMSAILCCSQLHAQLADQLDDCHVTRLVVDLEDNYNTASSSKQLGYQRESDTFYENAEALILYTSGTTGPPKGVVLSHSNLLSQCTSIGQCWRWTETDVALHVLPLHHLHGLVTVLLTALCTTAKCVLLERFDASLVWQWLVFGGGGGDWGHVTSCDRVTMLLAVPTVYSRLLQCHRLWREACALDSRRVVSACSRVRLMVSGSAALPETVMQKWLETTGHTLLERYGMTETGLALSNPLNGPRIPGTVGSPMPSVQVRLARFAQDGSYHTLAEANSDQCIILDHKMADEWGELLVRGPSVSERYWSQGRPAADFLADGWFRTGDTACLHHPAAHTATATATATATTATTSTPATAVFRIVGRTSVDVIKSGGYKVSALAVEAVLLQHARVQDVAVLGLPDPQWGQLIVAVVVSSNVATESEAITLDELRSWCSRQLPRYSLPSQLLLVSQLPRNAMGKVNKKQLARDIEAGRATHCSRTD